MTPVRPPLSKPLLAALTAAALAACSGGSGDGAGPGAESPANPDPGAGGKAALVASGPIAGFGSVYVGGTRFRSANADIRLNDQPAREADLQPGMVVAVFGDLDDDDPSQGEARRIEMRDLLRGPVSAIDVAAQRIEVLGTPVQIDERTVLRGFALDALTLGTVLAVSGEYRDDGSVLASFIGSRPQAGPEALLRGAVSAHDPDMLRFDLGRVRVDYSAASVLELIDGLSDGDLVLVHGRMDGAASSDTPATDGAPDRQPVFLAERVRELERDEPPADRPLRLHGRINAVEGGGVYRVRERRFAVDNATLFRFGGVEDLVRGAEVIVLGRADPERRLLLADQVAVLPRVNAAVEAQVERIDREARTLTVLGGLEIFVPEFAGHGRTDDAATDAARRKDDDDDEFGDDEFGDDGRADEDDDARNDRRFRLADIEPALAVRVVGHYADGRLVAHHIHRSRLRPGRAFVGSELQRIQPDTQRFALLGLAVQSDERTRFGEGGAAAFYRNAASGDRVAVYAAWDGSTLLARRVRHGAADTDGDDEDDTPPRLDRVDPERDNEEVDDEDAADDAAGDGDAAPAQPSPSNGAG